MGWAKPVSGVAVLLSWALGTSGQAEPPRLPASTKIPPVAIPADNPMSDAKVALGKQLYFDPRLSVDNTISCSSCHTPKFGWSDGEEASFGVDGKQGDRNSPAVINAAFFPLQFWDGRAASLEEQALGPIVNPVEMAMPSLDELEKKLNQIEGYRKQFAGVFGSETITRENVAKAIAAFERTILSSEAPVDRYIAGDKSALTPSAENGLKLFFGKANCVACHSGPLFTDGGFHNVGVGMDAEEPDLGREKHTGSILHRGQFKTPSLRDVDRTAPYFHNGSAASLEEVVEHFAKGGTPNPHLDPNLRPLDLTTQEKADLVTFLREGLASKDYKTVETPKLPD